MNTTTDPKRSRKHRPGTNAQRHQAPEPRRTMRDRLAETALTALISTALREIVEEIVRHLF